MQLALTVEWRCLPPMQQITMFRPLHGVRTTQCRVRIDLPYGLLLYMLPLVNLRHKVKKALLVSPCVPIARWLQCSGQVTGCNRVSEKSGDPLTHCASFIGISLAQGLTCNATAQVARHSANILLRNAGEDVDTHCTDHFLNGQHMSFTEVSFCQNLLWEHCSTTDWQ